MAFRLSFFKTPKHRVFNYKPLYYDSVQEELDERVARIREHVKEKEGAKENEEERTRAQRLHYPGKSIRGSFQRALYENRRRPDNKWLRLIVIVSITILLVAALYFGNAVQYFLTAMSK